MTYSFSLCAVQLSLSLYNQLHKAKVVVFVFMVYDLADEIALHLFSFVVEVLKNSLIAKGNV